MIYQIESHVADKLKVFFNGFDFIDKVVVFGSRARHDCNPKSDIDLCLYSLEMSDKQFAKLKSEIDELPILYKIDIVHFEKVNEELRANIERDEKLLFVKTNKLKDVSEIIMGQSPASSSYNSIGNGIPFFQGKKDFGELYTTTRMYCNEPKKIALSNDILFSVRAPVGDINLASEKSCIGRGLSAIRVKEDILERMYLFRYLQKSKDIIANKGNGSTFNSIKKIDLENIEIPLPTLTKQKKIAQTLDKAQELITLRKESIKKLDDLAKSLFIDMFGDPVSNPMKWETVSLNYYGSLARGKSSHRPRNAPELYNGEFPFIQTGDLSRGNNIYLNNYKQTYSEVGIKQSKLFPINTIGIAIAANIGNAKILKRDFYFPDSVVGFNTKCPEFTLYLLHFYKNKLDERATKTAQKNINLKILNELEVIKVPITLQNKFAKRIEKIEEQKALYEEELKKLQESFDSLLQRSFS